MKFDSPPSAVKLTDEDHQKLRTKQVANVIRKLNAGKTLTAREEALLAQERDGGEEVHTSGKLPPTGGYAKNYEELAKALGVTRKSLGNWRTRPDLMGKLPAPEADGRHRIADWLHFMVAHGLNRADENIDSSGYEEEGSGEFVVPPRIGGSQSDWNKAASHLDYVKRSDQLGLVRGTLLVATDLEVPLGATFAALQTKLSQFPARVARFVKGLRDESEVEERLRDEMDADLGELQAAGFVDTTVESLIANLPFNEETERQLKLITFDGQDRDNLLQLIGHVAIEALRQIGRRAMNPVPMATISSAAIEAESPTIAPSLQSGDVPSEAKIPKKPRKNARRKPTAPPAEMEAAIHPEPVKKSKTRRRK